MKTIKDNLASVRERIAAAARRAGRDREEVKLVAVSKRISQDRLQEAADCGQLIFGENYVQEAKGKIPCSDKDISWHLIGYLQSNKAKLAAQLFQVIETVDRLKLAMALDKHLAILNKNIDVLIQVNIGREPQKAGVLPENAAELVGRISQCRHLRAKGLMTMPPHFDDQEMARPYFSQMRKLAEKLQAQGIFGQKERLELSMGMSNDFEVAIEEGASLVRVGTAIFGPRN